MLSMPPATTVSCVPSCMLWAPSMTAFMPEAHTLLIVVQMTEGSSPAPRAACLAGACTTYLVVMDEGCLQHHAKAVNTSKEGAKKLTALYRISAPDRLLH